MKRFIFVFVLGSLMSGCQTSSDQTPKWTMAPGEVAFGSLAGFDRKQYLIEQHALLRSKVLDKGVESEIKGDTLTVNIPGNIAFSPNSARMNWNVHEILDRISPILKEYKYTSILVFGHSDSKGDRDVNQLLSEQRARIIREYFINSGVNILRITSRGLGGDDPLISDELTTLERSLNRRITLEIKIDEALVEKDSRDKGN
ncbi:conserved hypothetical protein [Bathymodiolus platifrons methanotrophic gill symbiont]|uniref:OmpA family protein n=1 Tax=Bathymodiolus platifrons methanotrophic gill symbiont TaxID=113268 RepID=UPI000B414219|nr:OmpA family protein [Bathymodiolus platifrons methanotrophic gill symbiont]MCK5869765.1 OmpA family protein [Methyloprofundus sp.]TXK96331.1 cell envelope biogenesis protein OmpA [Methylococcaceae bacterium CS4]TXK97578.1 cell envelope biogenesis protein OmpA [Methylococcaceae bacterium CS5]TXL05223.1 cell envelope biogenesis protein OmpA [Methylococcaceae bacterium CS1]TXL05604.1 cell envelope biogenesis protein OmpA [Methylococcaceae bacterium CS3]TXL08192.1 cell envelope biogenesis prot